ncbi:hypothetical protein E4U47_001111 [Claviceps purpurea]|nr:hypothetical protein E4U36_001089 [Claviceps purpurea]KAG6244027.1 hypothetical protein E4U25_005855 [Claviceps purpurea]KAG6267541.1 hypothetical protein E4U49_008002 [Claviceps purpurea]KAG6280263.1 hypothetical protein E4U47_001111 [Claviceps purpurea]
MSNQKPLNILIAGAGIAGPSLAFWLQRLGHSVTIIERSSSLRTGGQQLDIRGQGIEAIERMGIDQDVRQHVVDEAGVDIVDHNGESIIFFPRYETGRYSATLHPYIDQMPKPNPGLAWMIPKSTTGLKALNLALGLASKCNVPKLIQWFTAPDKDEWVMPWYQELHVGEEAVSVVK